MDIDIIQNNILQEKSEGVSEESLKNRDIPPELLKFISDAKG